MSKKVYILHREYARLLGLDERRLSSVPKHRIKLEMFNNE